MRKQVEQHYWSQIVEKVRERGGFLETGGLKVRLAKEFGFCYGVERAIDLAYASRRVFPDNRIFLIGEIIHNPEVNRQLVDMGIVTLPWQEMDDKATTRSNPRTWSSCPPSAPRRPSWTSSND